MVATRRAPGGTRQPGLRTSSVPATGWAGDVRDRGVSRWLGDSGRAPLRTGRRAGRRIERGAGRGARGAADRAAARNRGRRGRGAAALMPAGTVSPAGAATTGAIADPSVTTSTTTLTSAAINEAFAGVVARPGVLERWMYSSSAFGTWSASANSITEGSFGTFDYADGGPGCWVDRLTTAAGNASAPGSGTGSGACGSDWTGPTAPSGRRSDRGPRRTPSDLFDVCPFTEGFRSSDGALTTLTWTKRPTSRSPPSTCTGST